MGWRERDGDAVAGGMWEVWQKGVGRLIECQRQEKVLLNCRKRRGLTNNETVATGVSACLRAMPGHPWMTDGVPLMSK